MFSKLATSTLIGLFLVSPTLAQETSLSSRKHLKGRVEVNLRPGTERSILLTEFWVPITQNQADGSVIYGDLRLMGDNKDNNEFNVGLGYRKMVKTTLLGDGIIGSHIWYDRRLTKRGSKFNQITAGMEWFSDIWDAKINAYYPLNKDNTFSQTNPNGQGAGFAGNQIIINTNQTVVEESLPGLDLELGWQLPFADSFSDSTRIYVGGYHFEGDRANNVTGWRARISSDITSNIQLGARFQKDDERGSQGFLEATIRFPFGSKQSYKQNGLYARLDEAPERDIDIVSNEAVTEDGIDETLFNATTGTTQNVIHVDNTNGAGTGTAEDPFNTLAAAEAAAGANDIIYLHRGDGTTAGQANGININDAGQMLIGAGSNLIYNDGRFSTSNGNDITGSATTLISADPLGNPTITNGAGNGVYVTADGTFFSGFTVDGATTSGIYLRNNSGTAWNKGITIQNVTAQNNTNVGFSVWISSAGSTLDTVSFTNNIADNNGSSGFFTGAGNNGTLGQVNFTSNTAKDNTDSGFYAWISDGKMLETVSFTNNIADNNNHGFHVTARTGGHINQATFTGNTAQNNTSLGFSMWIRDAGSTLNMPSFTNNIANNNDGNGFSAATAFDGTINKAAYMNNLSTNNIGYGFSFSDNSVAGSITADMGGGAFGSTGNNSAYGNTLQELFVDLDGENLMAENNWWGNAAGLLGGELAIQDGSTVDTTPFLTSAP